MNTTAKIEQELEENEARVEALLAEELDELIAERNAWFAEMGWKLP